MRAPPTIRPTVAPRRYLTIIAARRAWPGGFERLVAYSPRKLPKLECSSIIPVHSMTAGKSSSYLTKRRPQQWGRGTQECVAPRSASHQIMDLMYPALNLAEAARLLRDGQVSPVALVRECLKKIEELNPKLNAFITVTADDAMQQAERAEIEIKHSNWRSVLHGIPVGVKDFFDTAGIKTTAAFEHFKNRVPGKDAAVVTQLKAAGAVIVGKTNMHTLGMGTTSVESCFGPVHNPWDFDYVAGGSSGGSAAAVAAGLCYATIDTDAIGSCRLPAACCGVTGFKPTFGLLSTQGILEGEPLDENTARTLAYIGHTAITCRTAEDISVVLSALTNVTECRPVSRIGITSNYKGTAEIRNMFVDAVKVFRSLQFETADIEVPFAKASFDLRDIEQDRAMIAESLFKNIDVLILPTTTDVTPSIEDVKKSGNAQAVSPDNTFFCNYYGLPSVSVPYGSSDNGLPLGFQIVGRQGSDDAVLKVAHAFQSRSRGAEGSGLSN